MISVFSEYKTKVKVDIDVAAAVICALTSIIDLVRNIVRDKQEERNHPRHG